jgi:hypothetical protein
LEAYIADHYADPNAEEVIPSRFVARAYRAPISNE